MYSNRHTRVKMIDIFLNFFLMQSLAVIRVQYNYNKRLRRLYRYRIIEKKKNAGPSLVFCTLYVTRTGTPFDNVK